MRKAAAVTIETRKPFGPSPGTFSSTGAIPESGTFTNSSVIFEDIDVSGSVTVHLTQRFDGTLAYQSLQGRGRVTGTADDNLDLITRTYTGTARPG